MARIALQFIRLISMTESEHFVGAPHDVALSAHHLARTSARFRRNSGRCQSAQNAADFSRILAILFVLSVVFLAFKSWSLAKILALSAAFVLSVFVFLRKRAAAAQSRMLSSRGSYASAIVGFCEVLDVNADGVFSFPAAPGILIRCPAPCDAYCIEFDSSAWPMNADGILEELKLLFFEAGWLVYHRQTGRLCSHFSDIYGGMIVHRKSLNHLTATGSRTTANLASREIKHLTPDRVLHGEMIDARGLVCEE